MEVDSGSCFSLLNSCWWRRLGKPLLRQGPLLRDVSRNVIPVLGMANVLVKLNGMSKLLQVVFLDRSDTASLLGREWIAEFNLLSVHSTATSTAAPISTAQHQPRGGTHTSTAQHLPREDTSTSTVHPYLEELLTEYLDIFHTSSLPSIKGFKAHLHIKPDANFKLHKPRPVPYALRPKVEAELDCLESLGIISKVDAAEFSTTLIVPVLKPTGQVRICGDFKVSLNQYLDLTQYPLPHIAEVFERLAGGRVYSKLNLPDAYLQVELDDESKRHVVITTHKGLYRYNRLCLASLQLQQFFRALSNKFFVQSGQYSRTSTTLLSKELIIQIIFAFCDKCSRLFAKLA